MVAYNKAPTKEESGSLQGEGGEIRFVIRGVTMHQEIKR